MSLGLLVRKTRMGELLQIAVRREYSASRLGLERECEKRASSACLPACLRCGAARQDNLIVGRSNLSSFICGLDVWDIAYVMILPELGR